jgi:phosphatidylinositol alpha-1,6-mannosyltransferase
MKTLLVSDIFPPKTGGSGRWFWEIYRRMPAQVVIAAGTDPRQTEFDQTHALRIYRLPLEMRSRALRSIEGLRGYWRGFRALGPLVRNEQIAQIHAARCLPEGLMARTLKWRYGIPYICYAHGEELGTASSSRELTWLTQRVLRGATFLVANSRNTQRILEEEWAVPAEKVRLLHPGVDTMRFIPAPPDPQARQRLGWEHRTVVLTVGRLQLRKGHDQMIRALASIRQSIPDVLYAIIGDGEERPALEALAQRERVGDHVQFLGEVRDSELVECYQQCDLFVLPNRAVGKDIEGFGMVLLEAQACGKAVVAGSSGGTAETMRIPQTGQVVPCEGPTQLGTLVADLLKDKGRLEAMGAAARSWVCEQFDWEPLSRQAGALFGLTPQPTKELAGANQAVIRFHG